MTSSLRTVTASLLRHQRHLLWLAVLVPLVAVAIARGVINLADQPVPVVTTSAWEYAGVPTRWMGFVWGALITPLLLPPYVASGISRRTVTWAAGIAGGLLAALIAGYLAAGYLVERAIFARAGRPHTVADAHLFTDAGQAHLVLAESALLVAAYLVSGWLIGSGFYRYGWPAGLPFLPLGMVPLLGAEYVLGAGELAVVGLRGLDLATVDLPLAATLSVTAGLVAIGLVGVRLVTRSVPVRSRRQP